jgi:hypothetical protein
MAPYTLLLLLPPLCGVCISNAIGVQLPVRKGIQEFPEPDVTQNGGCTDESCLELNIWQKRQQ